MAKKAPRTTAAERKRQRSARARKAARTRAEKAQKGRSSKRPGISKAVAKKVATSSVMAAALGYFAVEYMKKTRSEAIAKGEKSPIPDALATGYGPAALLAIAGYMVSSRQKGSQALGTQAGTYAVAAALAMGHAKDEKKLPGFTAKGLYGNRGARRSVGRLYQNTGRLFANVGAHGRASSHITNAPTQRIVVRN